MDSGSVGSPRRRLVDACVVALVTFSLRNRDDMYCRLRAELMQRTRKEDAKQLERRKSKGGESKCTLQRGKRNRESRRGQLSALCEVRLKPKDHSLAQVVKVPKACSSPAMGPVCACPKRLSATGSFYDASEKKAKKGSVIRRLFGREDEPVTHSGAVIGRPCDGGSLAEAGGSDGEVLSPAREVRSAKKTRRSTNEISSSSSHPMKHYGIQSLTETQKQRREESQPSLLQLLSRLDRSGRETRQR
jgi:hypothetical protein